MTRKTIVSVQGVLAFREMDARLRFAHIRLFEGESSRIYRHLLGSCSDSRGLLLDEHIFFAANVPDATNFSSHLQRIGPPLTKIAAIFVSSR